ncbi:hypothetical protein ACUY2K_03750 [Corynebacterium macginleyi]
MLRTRTHPHHRAASTTEIVWLFVMLAPILGLPAWSSALVWIAVSCISFIAFPHVDGTRQLAFV